MKQDKDRNTKTSNRQDRPFIPPVSSQSAERASQEAAQRRVPEQETGALPDGEGLYIISVAARILAMHPQTLRKYERMGFIKPSRTMGMLRLYSQEDIIRLRMIKHLVEDVRLNLAGVELVMAMAERLLDFRARISYGDQLELESLQGALEEILMMLQQGREELQ